MNSDSPVSRRLPAPSGAHDAACFCDPSPKIVLHLNAVVHVHHAAGLGDRRFARIELDLTRNCRSSPNDLVFNLVPSSACVISSKSIHMKIEGHKDFLG
jgi:hypothetical protein